MALAYLLCPTFQIENTAGKPATGGYLEVYIAGSRNKYYCASDFNGTLHPFRIELDSLGSNIVLADDTQAYDVYVYNRYGGLMMSRYGVKPGAGGGISSATITSTDGSIIVTPTENGVDLRVDSEPPTSMRCSASDLQESDTFEFVEVQRDGTNASVNNNGQVVVNSGWWHYDVVARLKWSANPAENITSSVVLYAPNGSSSSYFDRSYSHDETLQLSGEYKCTQDGTVFPVGVQDVPSGMTVELVDFGIHSVTGEGAGGVYTAGDGITIDEPNRVISVDFDDVQAKLTAGTGITIDENNVISATEAEIYTVEYTSTIVEGTELFDDAYAAYEAGKTLVLNWASADWKGSCIGYYSAYGLMFSVEKVNLSGNDATDGFIQYLWLYKYGTQSRWRSSSLKLLPRSSAADAGKVLMVDPEYPTSRPIWQELPAQQQADWTQSDSTAADYIKNKPTIPSGSQLVPAATSSDAGEVLTVDSNGDPTWAPAQAPISAGNGIDITNNVVSVDTSVVATQTDLAGKQDIISDLSSIRAGAAAGATAVQDPNYVHTDNNFTNADVAKLSGIEAGAEANVQSDWAESDSSSDSFIRNKPGQTSLVAGANITIVDDAQNNTVTISATGSAQVQANWAETDSTDPSYILNKPSIPVIGTITL